MPTCWIIAGPNGAGKTTFALQYLPGIAGCDRFINADLIAGGLSPFAPEKELFTASRIFIRELEERIERHEDFAFETTLSGRTYLQLVERLRAEGWHTVLLYLALPSANLSKMRVAERVANGGHNIPTSDIERRFPRSLQNLLENYSYIVDYCLCFMNNGNTPILVFEQTGSDRRVLQEEHYQHLLNESRI